MLGTLFDPATLEKGFHPRWRRQLRAATIRRVCGRSSRRVTADCMLSLHHPVKRSHLASITANHATKYACEFPVRVGV